MLSGEISRAQYLESLLSRKTAIAANGGVFVNPSIGNDVENQTLADNPSYIPVSTEKQEVDETDWGWFNWLKEGIGWVDDVAARFGRGFVGAFEGIGDFILTGVSAVGEGLGYDMRDLNNFIETNYADKLASWTQAYGTPWGNLAQLFSGNRDSEYWKNVGLAQLGPIAGLISSANMSDEELAKAKKQYAVGGGDTLGSLNSGVGNFIGNVSEGVGQMLPSIIIGNYAGAISEVATVGKAFGLGTMMVSAAGKGSEEALNEGASSAQALGYGAATGAVEGVTEWIGGKLGGYIPGSEVSIHSFADAAKMFGSEAFEEMLSGIMEPVTKTIYKGESALYDENGNNVYSTPEFWVTGDDSVLKQGLVGGTTGLIFGGVNTYSQKNALGSSGFRAAGKLEQFHNTSVARNELAKKYGLESINFSNKTETEINSILKSKGMSQAEINKFVKYTNEMLSLGQEIAVLSDEVLKTATDEQKANYAKLISDPVSYIKAMNDRAEEDNDSFISDIIKNAQSIIQGKVDINKSIAYENLDRINKSLGTNLTLSFDSSLDSRGKIVGDEIIINPQYADKYTQIILHETSHYVNTAMNDIGLRNMIDAISETEWFKENEQKIRDVYEDSDNIDQEIVGKYLETLFTTNDGKTTQMLLKNMPVSMVEKFLNIFKNTFAKTTEAKVLKQYNQQLRLFRKVFKKSSKMGNILNHLTLSLEAESRDIKKPTFKSISTTKEIVDNARIFIENKLGDNYKLRLPKDATYFSHKAFSDINSVVSVEKEANKLANSFLQSTVEVMDDETKTFVKVGKLNDLLTNKEKNQLVKAIEKIIKTSPDTEARSLATKDLQMSLDRMTDIAKEYRNRLNNIRIISKYRTKYKNQIKANYQITDDALTRDGLLFLYKSFAELQTSDKGFSKKGFKNNLNEALAFYNEQKINPQDYPNLPYEQVLRDKLVDLYDSLDEPITRTYKYEDGSKKEITIYGSLSSHSLQLAKEAMQMIEAVSNEARESYINKIKPGAIQAASVIKKMKYSEHNNILARGFRSYKRGFAPAYTVLREMLGGNSSLAVSLTTEIQNAQNGKTMYIGMYHDLINDKLKEFGIKKRLDKPFVFRGEELTYDQAMSLYVSLNVDANYSVIDENGIEYIDKYGKLVKLASNNEALKLKTEIEAQLPKEFQKMGDWLLDFMNKDIKSDYITWYEKRFGKYNNRNEIGNIGDNKYWMLVRSYQYTNNVEKAVSNPAAIFSHAKARVSNNNAVLLTGGLSGVTSYIDSLAKEIYIKPIYRNAIATLNVKLGDGSNVTKLLKEKVSSKDIQYLNNTLEDLLGAFKGNESNLLNSIISRFSVAKLSLNVGTMFKQFASIWTSNIPFTKSAKALLYRMFTARSSAFKTEYADLVKEIGGLKYRESNSTVIKANADGLSGTAEAIADIGMKPISKMDLFTVGTGVYSLMIIGQDQYGYKIGSKENFNFVKEHWSEFELSQIGNTALSKNAVARGDYGSIVKGVFGFMQGANRAALGSFINKINLYKRNHTLSKADLKNTLASINEEVKNYEEEHSVENEEGKKVFKESSLSEADAEKYIELKSKQLDADIKYKEFEKYEVAGGKAIPAYTAAGLIAQGAFVALITELMRHIKGKKDWDEWDFAEFGTNTLLAIGVDWIPFVNAIESMIKGYDVTIPALDIMNEFVSIVNNAKEGDWKTTLREIAVLIGDACGIPVDTLYSYLYGALKTFNPEVAFELNSVLYGSSSRSITNSIKEYAARNNEEKTAMMIGLSLKKYKTIEASDDVSKELAYLYMQGYSALPKDYLTSYIDDEGNTVELSEKQIEDFKKAYSTSDQVVNKLINSSYYSSLTDEEKSILIKKVYDAYYYYAKGLVTETKTSNRLSNLLLASKGNINISKYVRYMDAISKIEANKTKTRKELVVNYVNKISNLSKQEKNLLMVLSGYSVSGDSQKQLYNYLIKNGASRNDAMAFLGMDQK